MKIEVHIGTQYLPNQLSVVDVQQYCIKKMTILHGAVWNFLGNVHVYVHVHVHVDYIKSQNSFYKHNLRTVFNTHKTHTITQTSMIQLIHVHEVFKL